MKQQLTLIAFYGEKQDELRKLIEELQTRITDILGKKYFTPYNMPKIHGTIIGLEGKRNGSEVLNENCLKKGEEKPMNIEGLIDFILSSKELLPIKIQVGGYKKEEQYPFNSNGKHPYIRSFSIQKKIVVAMGWPIKNKNYPPSINELRKAFGKFNVLHKYYQSLTEGYDNDFFFVLGNLTEELDGNLVARCEQQIRDFLENNELSIEITQGDLKIVVYLEGDTKLLNAREYSLKEAKAKIQEVIAVYP